MANQIIQSIKTIAQSLVDNAGYDKTRGGLIVGVNTITNTYSVKVDGVTYPIVRAVDDATYNIGDVVKVVIPCNQATQMYISSSVLSDNSLGNKIANAVGLAEDAKQLGLDNQVEIKDVSDIANSKNKTFRQDTEPTEGMSSGDVWIDTSDNNTLYVYDGTQWVFSGGGNGQDGLNNATILLYKRGATAPDKPTAEVTYTFADASLSPTDASLSLTSALNGWTQAIPQVDGNPCWVIAATASATTATDTIGVSEWSTQIKFVEDGVQGATGATGNTGTSSYTYIRYSVNANGNPMVTTPTDATLYIGVYTGTSSTAPTSYTSYTWSRYTGQDGATGATGATGKTGATGATGATGKTGEVGATGSTGLNQATIFLYSRTTSTKPSSPTTYTFASGVLSPLPSNWSRSVPTNNGDPCYVTTAIAIGYGSDVTITSDAWSDPTVLVENGAEGYSPTVSTGTSSDGSTTITVTNKDGSTTTELVDGTARDDANTANTTANAAREKILSWCYENNETFIDGAKIYTGSIDAESINVESLTADTAFIDEMETTLTRFKAVGENGYYETEITGEGIDFKYGTSEETAKTIAGISGDELQIKKTSVLDEMNIGKWSWKVNPNNNHLTLKWNGGDDEQ